MKKYILLLLLCPLFMYGQNELKFDKRVIDSEDKWVVIPAKDPNTYLLGFVYLDLEAGLTFDLRCWFNIDDKGKYVIDFSDTTLYRPVSAGSNKLVPKSSYKMRLEQNARLASWLTKEKHKELEL